MKNNKPATKRAGRPHSALKDHSKASSAEKGTAPGYMRKSYVANIELSNKMDGIAYWDRKTIKEVVFEAMTNYILAWEKKNGPVKPLPKK